MPKRLSEFAYTYNTHPSKPMYGNGFFDKDKNPPPFYTPYKLKQKQTSMIGKGKKLSVMPQYGAGVHYRSHPHDKPKHLSILPGMPINFNA